MSISRNILLCTVCQALFHDARQLRCGHSFCYQCIAPQFDATSLRIACPRCRRVHQFDSSSHFQMSLIVDAFVMSLVSEHRRKMVVPTTPLLAFTLEQILQRSPTPFVVAKCAQCTIRKELVVCPDCEQVICFDCITQHQLIVNNHVQQQWQTCKQMWQYLYEKSMLFEEQQFSLESHMFDLIARVEKRAAFLFQTIGKWYDIYYRRIDQAAIGHESVREEMLSELQYTDQRAQALLNSNDHDPIEVEHFLHDIQDLQMRLRQRSRQIEQHASRTLSYATSDFDAAFLGLMSFETAAEGTAYYGDDDDNNETVTVQEDDDDEDEPTGSSSDTPRGEDQEPEVCENPLPHASLENIPSKKLLWSLQFKFVPQYVVLYRQSILFASDRWGFVSTWTYTNARTKPVPKKSFVLFPQFRVGTWSRVYVESFSVYKPYICVFVKGSDEALTNFIAFFSHTGQLQMKVEYDHRYTLRQLICDESTKGNCIWTVDRGTHCIYKHDLPRTSKEIKSFLSTHKTATRLNDRSCDVIRMAINQNLLALLDSRTQIITFYDKVTQKEVGVYTTDCLPTGENKLWRVEIFPDNSLLLRFDDNERTGDRSQVIHHIVVHVRRNESNGRYEAMSQIQATNVYGFAIGAESEVIVGVRKPNCFEGLIACYV